MFLKSMDKIIKFHNDNKIEKIVKIQVNLVELNSNMFNQNKYKMIV